MRSIVTEPTTATVAGILLEGSFMLFNDAPVRRPIKQKVRGFEGKKVGEVESVLGHLVYPTFSPSHSLLTSSIPAGCPAQKPVTPWMR